MLSAGAFLSTPDMTLMKKRGTPKFLGRTGQRGGWKAPALTMPVLPWDTDPLGLEVRTASYEYTQNKVLYCSSWLEYSSFDHCGSLINKELPF